MARRQKRKLTYNTERIKRRLAQTKPPIGRIDTKMYIVSKVLGSKLEGNRISYDLAWTGYPSSENSYEEEKRLHCTMHLQQYAKKSLLEDYMDSFDNIDDEILNVDDATFLEKVNPLAIIALNYSTPGVQFMSNDSLGAKRLFMRKVLEYGGEWMMRTINKRELNVEMKLDRYRKELDFRVKAVPNYPSVNVYYVEPPIPGRVVPPPPPMCNIIFEPVDNIKDAIRDSIIVEKSTTATMNGAYVFAHENLFSRVKPELREAAHDYNIPLLVTCGEKSVGWCLRSGDDISADTAILQMAGVVVDEKEAKNSLKNDGDAIAITSFVQISNTGKCLDRRVYYDYSKFMKQNCNPNCAVRYELGERPEPNLVVYALENIAKGEYLTLDYFASYNEHMKSLYNRMRGKPGKDNVKKLSFLQNSNVDHVICNCDSPSCRLILLANCANKKYPDNTKKETQLKDMAEDLDFKGLKLRK